MAREANAWQQFMVPRHIAGIGGKKQSDVHSICLMREFAMLGGTKTPGPLLEIIDAILQMFCVHFWPGIWNAGESVIIYEIKCHRRAGFVAIV
jgi:hypothetical protein